MKSFVIMVMTTDKGRSQRGGGGGAGGQSGILLGNFVYCSSGQIAIFSGNLTC